MAEVISKILYPADDHIEGKRLRIKTAVPFGVRVASKHTF
ncbi:MAG: glycogen/starch/alpha-glucan phosphorylase [Clostridiales bacterium]|nr:MAG: glycogen/starch/alpha-glucan phosphorylase [Clostridiales bacterium]